VPRILGGHQLLQEFAINAAESGQGIDGDTREKLIAIRDILTNETYIALEQAHRHDQDLLDKHARAINECGYKHIMHLQQDIEGQEVQLVRDTEASMYKCQGLPVGLVALQKPERFWSNWTGVNDPKYDDPNFVDCSEAHLDMFTKCNELDNFIRGLPKPNCVPPAGTTAMEAPSCNGGQPTGVDIDLFDWFTNMKENALFYQETWRDLKVKCDNARDYYKEICLDECARKQRIFEQAFCSYRQGLHATCREYQGCHVLNEEEFMDLLNTVMYNADGRKIDWKAIHKIECYINVLVSTETNEVRAKDLLNCEAGNLNTIETILTGFNETNYLSLIAPEINVSCWNLDVPQYIDWKECDMTSVHQYPCTEKWMDRYNGLTAPADCTECAPIPDEFQYHLDTQRNENPKLEEYGGGWYYVHELGRSKTDIDDLTEMTPGGYHLPIYVTTGLRWNEVLVQRVSQNWCDSWGSQSSYWAEDSGASMCVQSDLEHVYCMNNANGVHSWRQQPVSHFTVNCGMEGQPACDCWPKNKDNICWAYNRADASGPTLENIEAPRHIRILSMEEDGSVVKISFQGQEKSGTLKVGNYNAFMQDAEGCRAITPVKYRVYVRCMGCSTSEDGDFHVFDGAQFNGKMHIGHMAVKTRTHYTYEGWFRSPLAGKQRREILGGSTSGLTLINEGAVPCLHDVGPGYMKSGTKESGYQLHVGGTDKYGAFCFEEDTWYFIAVTKNLEGDVQVFVNGRDMTTVGHKISSNPDSTLEPTVGGGFIDGGQLFNLRIWDYARTQLELYTDAFSTRFEDMQTSVNGLAHWWPMTNDLKDLMTGSALTGPEARFKPVWWSDLEISGMRGGWKAGYGLPFGDSACGGAGVFHQTCGAKDASLGCVYVSKDRADQCNYIGGNHITDWGCYTDVSDNCEPRLQAGSLVSEDTHLEGSKFVKQHTFELVFAKKPVVVAVMGSSGPHSAHVQIFDVTKEGFSYAIQEPHGWDGKHVAEKVNFVAAVSGTSTLTEGITVQAGVISTLETVGSPIFPVAADGVTGVYVDHVFEEAYAELPALLTGVQTMNNQELGSSVSLRLPWLVPAVTGLSMTGFKISLDRCEATPGAVSQPEEIGYIALTPGHGVCAKSSCYHAKFSIQHALTSGADMGWDDRESNLEAVTFPEHFENNNVIAVASKSTRAGNNGGWMRIASTDAHAVKLFVDEDTSNDEERLHISEDVAVIAFSEPFVF